MVLRWLMALLLWARVEALREQKFAMEPQDQTAVVGSRVTLPCRVINKSGLLQWTKDGFGLGNLTGYDRYSIVGSGDEGDYSLDIYPVTLDDDAPYSCQVSAGPDGESPIRSKVANLSVLVPPESPRIIQGSHLLTTEDREIELECVSIAGKPPAEITWVDGVGNLLRDKIEYLTEQQPDQKTYTARSILKLTARKEHHNTTFTCQAQNTADRTYRSARLRLEVKYAPKVRVYVVGNGSRLVEGQDVRLVCSAAANPPDITYRWFINNQLVLGDPTTELVLKNISQSHHKSVVRCEVHNVVGKSEEAETLDIGYGPRFRIKPYSVQADVGASVTLTCDVDGNPSPNIVWIHEDSGRVVSTSPNLTLTVAPDTAGRYFCRATVPGFPDIRAEATIYMKGPPTIVSHRTQYGIPGDNIRLECSAFSIPTPQKVVWSFKGEDVGSDLAYSVLEDQITEGIKSTLIIRDSRQEHFGIYNCTVSNPYGSDVVEITLKAQKSFPLHSTLIGVMGGIVVFMAVTTILILCQRNRVSKPQGEKVEEVKQPKESDLASNISDLKLELEYSGSETGSESAGPRAGLPLAGPVPLDTRYSQCYTPSELPDTFPPPQLNGLHNDGYVPYVDYTREYNPPAPLPAGVSPVPPAIPETTDVDPRYSAVYGNPYLRHTVSPQLPPPPNPPTALSPPPYNILRNGATPQTRPPLRPTSQTNKPTLATHV
uniref:Ig-like domain-containing protein n=2 Tax=Graphocephala atropunctata TaxID=36148 RepID=A0A1B6LJR2_9HEMI